MTSDYLNEFQTGTSEKIVELLKAKGRAFTDELYNGPGTEHSVRIESQALTFWIYIDGAEVLGPILDERFEIYDYRSLDELRNAFLQFSEDVLSKDVSEK